MTLSNLMPKLKDVNVPQKKECHASPPSLLKVFSVRPSVKPASGKNNKEGKGREAWHISMWQSGKLSLTAIRPLYRSLPMPKVRDSRMSVCHCFSKKPRSGTFFICPLTAVYGLSL